MADLLSADNPQTVSKFKQLGLPTNLLTLGFGVKFPEEVEPGKKYDVVLRERPSALDKKDGGTNAVFAEDEGFSKYNPGWPTQAPPFDARFPHQNQIQNCERNYIDYHRCKKIKGEDYEHCNYFKKVYMARCPSAWTNVWDEQIENGSFRHRI